MSKETGYVKWFNSQKGFGFIEGEPDVFAHYKEITAEGFKTLRKGQKVEFVRQDGEHGPLATEIEVLE